MELNELMFAILDHSCSSPVDYDEWAKDQRNYKGWSKFYIETHCIAWRVIAKKIDGQWIIKEARPEDC